MAERIALILGAGFSASCGLPLAREIFDSLPEVDVASRDDLLRTVQQRWQRWHARTGRGPEQYLAEVQGSAEWFQAVRFVALRLVMKHGHVGREGSRRAIHGHEVTRSNTCPAHADIWDSFFVSGPVPSVDLSVVTTNYDVLVERGLRMRPMPTIGRPGFRYGRTARTLIGRGYPFHRSHDLLARGDVSLFKLHGSISRRVQNGVINYYADCSPGITGDAAIVAPAEGKSIPGWARPIWDEAGDSLAKSPVWISIGYSFPAYDTALRDLLRKNAPASLTLHLFNPSAEILRSDVAGLLPGATVIAHPGLPAGLAQLRASLAASNA